MNKKIVMYGIMLLLMTTLLFVIVEVAARIFTAIENDGNYLQPGIHRYDPKLGWAMNDGIYRQIHTDFDVSYSVVRGIRKTDAPYGRLGTINFFGDSFCFGIGVDDNETIPAYFARMTAGYQSINYGISGFGPDQYQMRQQLDSTPGTAEVFLILTGNDYKNINMSTTETGDRNKPFYMLEDEEYRLVLPAPPEENQQEVVLNQYNLKSVHFLKQVAKSIPFVVSLRNQLKEVDQAYVISAVQRFEYVFQQADKERTYFFIIPSLSLLKGISTSSEEGLFENMLYDRLMIKGFNVTSLLHEEILIEKDFWAHEGHPNQAGNKKIAKAVFDRLSADGLLKSDKGQP